MRSPRRYLSALTKEMDKIMKKTTTGDDITEMFTATAASAALGAAVETGLLWRLAAQPLCAEDIVASLRIPGRRGYYWLQFLEEIGVLDGGPQGYSPSAAAREAILQTRTQESWQHLALDERERVAGLHNLALCLSEPGSIWTAQGLPAPINYVEKMRHDPARAREFTRMLFEVHQPLAGSVANLVDLTGARRLMDLGGGSGVISMALLRKYPALSATVVDLENVCIAGREIADEQGLSGRISYFPADFEADEFPQGFDAIIQCDVGLLGLPLFQKMYQCLNPGGRVIFIELLSPNQHAAPLGRVRWTFLDSLHDPNFGFPTPGQAAELLAQAGFEVLPGLQPAGKLTVLQARKR